MRTSWFGGWCEGAGRARARTHSLTRARTEVHTRAHQRVREPTPSGAGGPGGCSPPLATALAGWGGGQEAVTGARAPLSRSLGAAGPSGRRGPGSTELGASAPGDRARRLSRHFIPGRLAVGAARGGWGRGRLTGGARGGGAQGPRVPGLPGGAGAHSWTRPRAPRACLVGSGAPG